MPRIKHPLEQIISKLREGEVASRKDHALAQIYPTLKITETNLPSLAQGVWQAQSQTCHTAQRAGARELPLKFAKADVSLPDGMNVNHTLVKDGWCWWNRTFAAWNTRLGKDKDGKNSFRRF